MFAVAFAHQKGGSGKSTLAVHSASAAHLAGFRTKLLDLDAQASAAGWGEKRAEGSRHEGLVVELLVATNAKEKITLPRFREATDGFDVAVIDCPAREPGLTRSAAAFADTVVVPIAPGPFDLWSVERDTIESLNQADEIRADIGRPPIRRCFVVNAVRAGSVVARESQEAIELLAGDFLGVIHHRVSFPWALNRGESVFTVASHSAARAEIASLWRALKPKRRATR